MFTSTNLYTHTNEHYYSIGSMHKNTQDEVISTTLDTKNTPDMII